MINIRLAWILAHEILGTPWEDECLRKGLNPSIASADQVIGKMRGDMWDADGNRVLAYDDDQYRDLVDGLEADQATVEVVDPRIFVAEVTEVAGLTKTERRVVSAIVDGSPIPDGKKYTGPLALRLNMTTDAVKKAWSRAKAKLREHWVAE